MDATSDCWLYSTMAPSQVSHSSAAAPGCRGGNGAGRQGGAGLRLSGVGARRLGRHELRRGVPCSMHSNRGAHLDHVQRFLDFRDVQILVNPPGCAGVKHGLRHACSRGHSGKRGAHWRLKERGAGLPHPKPACSPYRPARQQPGSVHAPPARLRRLGWRGVGCGPAA